MLPPGFEPGSPPFSIPCQKKLGNERDYAYPRKGKSIVSSTSLKQFERAVSVTTRLRELGNKYRGWFKSLMIALLGFEPRFQPPEGCVLNR